MKHVRILLMLHLLIVSTALAYLPDDADSSRTISLNGQWKFKLIQPDQIDIQQAFVQPDYDDSAWADISVPSNWEMQGFEEPRYSDPTNTIGLYRCHMTLPDSWKDLRVLIRFEGVLFGYEVFVNGVSVGIFESAFQIADFDITDHIKWNETNVLAVRVYKDFPSARFDTHDAWALSGIFRDVSLFALPYVRIEDVNITTKIKDGGKKAQVIGRVDFAHIYPGNYKENSEKTPQTFPLKATVTLTDPSQQLVKTTEKEVPWRSAYEHFDQPDPMEFKIKVDKAEPWSAEHPHLYTLTVKLYREGQLIHTVIRRVGLREITIDDDVLKFNGKPFKIRGVCRHAIDPVVGRALREEHWIKDLELMKNANINAVRTSHYPPNQRFLDLCDEYGMYVICEVPFGGGDRLLTIDGYFGQLLARAENTVRHHKMHPCVIAWSVGNENAFPPNVNRTGAYVKMLDSTRPILMAGGMDLKDGLPRFVDIFSPHYPSVEALDSWGQTRAARRPIICTEFNHAFGHAFGYFYDTWEAMEKYDNIAGGMIWHWCDQGLMRKVDGRTVYDSRKHFEIMKDKPSDLSGDYWLDDNTILDSHGLSGTDGIVYANRVPQEDYWQTRKVYSPIVIDEKQIAVKPGENEIEFHVQNRYDFTDLKETVITWQLLKNTDVFGQGNLQFKIKPHKTEEIELELFLPDDLSQNDYRLLVAVKDYNNRDIYEHIIRLIGETGPIDLVAMTGPPLQPFDVVFEKPLQPGNQIDPLDEITLPKGISLTPILRIGREATIAERRTYSRFGPDPIWDDYLLYQGALISRKVTQTDTTTRIHCLHEFPRVDKPDQKVRAEVVYDLHKDGWIDVYYQLNPIQADGYLLEAGLGFVLPDTATEFRWLGDGPYSSHPDKKELSERGVYHLTASDPYFPGNRANVDLAAITDEAGNGLGIVANQANIHCELTGKGMTVTHNAIVTGLGTKGRLPRPNTPAKETKNIRGAFRIQPLNEKQWPDTIKKFIAP